MSFLEEEEEEGLFFEADDGLTEEEDVSPCDATYQGGDSAGAKVSEQRRRR